MTRKAQTQVEYPTVLLHLRPALELTCDQLLALSQLNRDLRMELTAQGDLLIMPPTFGETGNRNALLNAFLTYWALQDGTGVTFDSSTGFTLPNGAIRSPDAAWVKRSRLMALTPEQKQKFLPLCPDFVIELRSASDSLSSLQDKMQEYMDNGAQLGWLIDPQNRHVYLYHPNRQMERLSNATSISGDPLLPGFVLDLKKIWEVNF